MRYTPLAAEDRDPGRELCRSLEPVIRGLGMSLIELSVSGRKVKTVKDAARSPKNILSVPRVQIRAVVLSNGITGLDDCSRVHRSIMPRLELAFPGQEIYLEVSSPGIDRLIRDGGEFVHYVGRGVKCYCTDVSGWIAGVLLAADEEKIVLRDEKGETVLFYEKIAKARLDSAAPL